MNGVFYFDNQLIPNQLVSNNLKLGTIIPIQKPNPIIAICHIASPSSGKIIKGQKAIIEIDDYPSNEFGKLNGIVVKASSIGNKDEKNNINYIIRDS